MNKLTKEEVMEKVHEISMEQRKRLLETIKTNHLTYIELEKLTGVAKSSIQRYLTGETTKIPADFFTRVSIVTNTPREYLLCLDNKKIVPIETNQDDLTTTIQNMPEEDRERIKELSDLLQLKRQVQNQPK
jgi:transcriptional regulator with XRE-family HTH domain